MRDTEELTFLGSKDHYYCLTDAVRTHQLDYVLDNINSFSIFKSTMLMVDWKIYHNIKYNIPNHCQLCNDYYNELSTFNMLINELIDIKTFTDLNTVANKMQVCYNILMQYRFLAQISS